MSCEPSVESAPQQRNLRLKPHRERPGRAVGGGTDERRLPAGVGLRARVVIGEVLDQHRPAVTFEQLQGREDHPLLECRVVRRTKRPPKLEGYPKRTWWFGVFGLRPNEADRDRRNALVFEIMSQRAHGARAYRSNGG